MSLNFTPNQFRVLTGTLFIPILVFVLNYTLRLRDNYHTSSADLLLLFIIFDGSSIIFASQVSSIIHNQRLKSNLITILVLLLFLTISVWLLIVIWVEDELVQAMFNAIKNATPQVTSLQEVNIEWPLWPIFLAWFLSGFITISHLGLVFMPADKSSTNC